MYYTYDRNNKPDKPYVYLASANKDYMSTIQAREISGDLCYNNISQISFVVNKYENGIKTENYDEIENLMLVEISYISWFQITTCNEVGTGLNSRKEITALSLENEATSKILTSFGQLGVDTDEQGGLDRYCLYNLNDIDHSILHIFIDKMPSWSIGYVDPEITKEYRSFTDDSIGAYAFLTTSVAEAFECVFSFNTFDQTVSAYTLANAGKDTQIFLDYRNLIKKLNKKSEASDIFTVMTVAGGDDRGSTMGIIEVNPAGTNQIYNFEYFKPKMSEPLRIRLTEYEIAYDNLKESFGIQLDRWNTLIDELGKLNTRYPENESSTNWTEYGLSSLQTKSDYYHERMSQYTTLNQNASYKENQQIWSAINAEIAVRKAQINTKEAEIAAQEKLVQGMKINLREFLGETLFKELSRYWHETTFTDSTFIVTDKMTEAEAFQMRRDLLDASLTKLATVSKPQFTIDIDSVNFTEIPEFMEYTKELELGNIITVDMGDGLNTEARILKIHMDWDNPDNFSITISSKNSLDGFEYEFAEILSLPNAAGTANAISGTGWNNAKAKVPEFDDYKSGNLDLQKQKLLSGRGEEVVVDTTGMLLKRFDYGQNKYSDNQLWATSNGICLTKNSWEDVAMAIGEGIYNGSIVYGVWADLICGDLLLSKELRILNANSSIILNENGATFRDCDITITRGTSVLTLNAAEGIRITKSGANQFYLDGSGNVVFAGNLSGATGTFSGEMTAGSININNRFRVDSNGNMTANNVTINSGTFSGTLYGAGGSFSGSLSGASGSFSGSISASTITGTTITGSTITGSTLNTNNGAFTVNSYGVLHANSATFGSGSTTMSIDNNGFRTYQNGEQKSNLYINGLITELIAANSISVFVRGSAKSVIHEGNISSYLSDYALSTHYHGTLYAGSSPYGNSVYISTAANFVCPDSGDLGTSSNPWINVRARNVYNSAGIITSSDRRRKNAIEPLNDKYSLLFDKLVPVSYKYNDGTSGRTHLGLIAQEVEQAMQDVGLSDKECAILVKDPIYEKMNKDGSYDETSEIIDYDYSIRYSELIPMLMGKIKELELKIGALEK